ncbi:protein KAKU4-like isoform X2 [Gastrolobium bilobum]|uniref:protein KAKU4-like isoform X2 n=1 Tax=Gastrolobium bilobum TaxID=150636 RepID=UPI002AAFFC70|nr:protein KAKU4-like isoform X2 [Gastrolobium bilobum]
MASIPGSRSGGKMVRTRRTASARTRTPYDRPDPSQSPNWLSRFVVSPTRFIASGAGKLFSSVLDLNSSPTSSSSATSSPSSSANDSSDEEVGTFDDENDSPFEGDIALNKPLVWNSKSKHIIEQLLMQESFSREECDRLIKIIRSRVVDSPANDDDGDKRPRDIFNMTFGNDSPDLCSAAVMEAKKWLQEKKSGLDSNSDLGYGSHSLILATSPQDPKDEGSPVDVAKSYMRTRPPWASPSIDHTKPPTPSGIQLFKEETPHLFGGNSTSSSKLKRDSPATGSWSIQDEIRRVRSRATEEMLRTLPSSKIDWSAFAVEHKNNVNSSAIEIIEASLQEKENNFTNLEYASTNLARGLGSQASPDLESKLDGFQPESVLCDPANNNSEQNQGFVAVLKTKGTQDDCREITSSGLRDGSSDDMLRYGGLVKVNGNNDTNGSNHQRDSVEETREALNSRLQDGKCLVFKEKVGADDAWLNGFPSSEEPSLYAENVIEQGTRTLDNESSAVDSRQERTAQGVLEQETCKLLRESMEVPDMNVADTVAFKEDDGVATGSQNSSSVQDEVQPNSSRLGSESSLAATPTSIAKQKGKRITRYNRRGKSRGVK